ncbi:MAG: transposase [bacterium]|nr:transposase [bacterium]
MSRLRRSFDREFRDGAVRIVKETGRPVAHVARELGVCEGTLGNWVRQDQAEQAGGLTADERAELARLRKRVAEPGDGA